ncbi:MAG TPA: glycosyltransferase [Verrucomicrobiae bacterium]|nr:glycosyltransferase [Verrucomicrobiae bacterium]
MNDQTKTAVDFSADLWQRDEPLRRAAELIEQSAGRIRAVSFDFFDTIVWRLVGKPTDIFNEVARRLHAEKLLRPEISPADYEVIRRRAEARTREAQNVKDNTVEDISLIDVYGRMLAVIKDPAAAAAIEHAVEQELCILNPIMAGFIRHVLAKGLKAIVVSDIYFSAAQLKSILRANQFDPELFELVITSADAKVCKGTGNLFKHVLKTVKLEGGQVIHIGDNYHADVVGARKAGVRGCHYQQASQQTWTILEREKFLLGGQELEFNANSIRMLAARLFPADTDEAFFGRMGTLIMGPTLTRFASWACEQFVAGGVRKVGALMREGELFGKLLQQEADARGYDLEITPMYVNRKATDLAAIGRLTADNVIAWLEARPTLPIRTILEHFGLSGEVLHQLPLPLDEKADKPEKILAIAKFLFMPEVARRVEEKSAEERAKVMDYLKPWLESGLPFGVCDIGYSASAQTQLKRIFDLENIKTHMVGCYLVSYERAADRVLDGVDIRSFLGAFGHPDFYYRAFIRGPAFMEQSITAACGTTLGYERLADGSIKPILDKMPYDEKMLGRQRAFKTGVLEFQKLWHWTAKLRTGLLDGSTEFSHRILSSVDRGFAPILGRATSFPTAMEVERFGSLALDDYYFVDSYKTLCGEKDREKFRKNGYAKALGEAGVHWPHGLFHLENPRTASEFFSLGKAMMYCDTNRDGDSPLPEITILLTAGRDPLALRECLDRIKNVSNQDLRYEVFLLIAKDNKEIVAAAESIAHEIKRFRVFERGQNQSLVDLINIGADNSVAPFLMVLDEGTQLAPGWDAALLKSARASKDIGMVLPKIIRRPEAKDALAATLRAFVVPRQAFVEGLGFNCDLTPTGAIWSLALRLRELNLKTEFCPGTTAEVRPAEVANSLASFDKTFLTKQCAEFNQFAEALSASVVSGKGATVVQLPSCVDWVGSFLDHGSLSHVNREFTRALAGRKEVKLQRVGNGAAASPAFKNFSKEVSSVMSSDVTVTVRHAWPPNWQRPKSGALVVIQPWEFGALPTDWVKQAANVDEFWLPSDYVRRVYAESGVPASKLFVVPNGVDVEKFNPQAAPMKLATQKKFKFLFVGGTIYRKGPDVLLKAYLERFTAADDVCLVIKDFGGQSVYAGQTFEQQIRAAQAQPDAPEILYINEELSPESLPGLYTACDCFVLAYRGEGFGLPALEAMACGLPTVVTAGGATNDFARADIAYQIPAAKRIFGDEVSGMKLAGSGWMLEPDFAALGEKMRWIFANPLEARERGVIASKHVQLFWTWKKSAEVAVQRIAELSKRNIKNVGNTVASSAKPEEKNRRAAAITLPSCALVGHLGEAREAVRQKKLPTAWNATLAAIAKRPFNPEAYLLLAEIALAAGDGADAKVCAELARRMAPGFKDAKKFLNQRMKGDARPSWLVMPQIGSNRLSVCLIVKNEEKFIGQCLKSITGLDAQIVLVDTGSTDRTVEIAKEHKAEIHSFKWCDDFSAARNVALEHATGDWVLVLDADEELSADAHAELKAAMATDDAMAWRLPIVDIGREADGCSYVPRLFRNAPALFYLGRIHEQVFTSIEVRREEWGLTNNIGKATLIHHGYTAEVTRDRNKNERNLKLLERAIEELPDEPHLLMNLGLELSRCGREQESLARYQEAWGIMAGKVESEIVPELRETLLTQLCARLTGAKQFGEIISLLNSPQAKVALTASLHFSLGLAYLESRKFSEAAEQMNLCLAKRSARSLAPINKDILTAAPHHCLALALFRAGDGAGADKAFQAGLNETGHGEGLRMDYAKFLAEQNQMVPALERLNEIVSQNPGNLAAWQMGGKIALSQPDFLEFACDWTSEAMKATDDVAITALRAEALMLSNDTAGALPLWQRVWNAEAKPQVFAAVILCHMIESSTVVTLQNESQEAATSRAFIQWYQKLLAFRAVPTAVRLNDQIEKLGTTLPTAAKILGAAMAEANQEAAVA